MAKKETPPVAKRLRIGQRVNFPVQTNTDCSYDGSYKPSFAIKSGTVIAVDGSVVTVQIKGWWRNTLMCLSDVDVCDTPSAMLVRIAAKIKQNCDSVSVEW